MVDRSIRVPFPKGNSLVDDPVGIGRRLSHQDDPVGHRVADLLPLEAVQAPPDGVGHRHLSDRHPVRLPHRQGRIGTPLGVGTLASFEEVPPCLQLGVFVLSAGLTSAGGRTLGIHRNRF